MNKKIKCPFNLGKLKAYETVKKGSDYFSTHFISLYKSEKAIHEKNKKDDIFKNTNEKPVFMTMDKRRVAFDEESALWMYTLCTFFFYVAGNINPNELPTFVKEADKISKWTEGGLKWQKKTVIKDKIDVALESEKLRKLMYSMENSLYTDKPKFDPQRIDDPTDEVIRGIRKLMQAIYDSKHMKWWYFHIMDDIINEYRNDPSYKIEGFKC